jgi:glycosyltransferase involved in cell wall biosynthesis
MSDCAPRVSIGLPVYNGHAFLRAAIESILAQTFTDFELVICDNASTDDTPAICQAFAVADPRVRYVRNETNLGAAPNFNKAFRLSRGEYFKWAAADDRIEPEFLRCCVAVLDADASAVLCHTRPGIINAESQVLQFEGPERVATWPDGSRLKQSGVMDPRRPLDSQDVAARVRSLLTQTQWCFESFGLIRADALRRTPLHMGFYGSDKVLLLALALQGRFAELPEPLFLRRFHSGQSSEKSPRQQATWMDARAKLVGSIVPAQIRCFKSYLALVASARLGIVDRLLCLAAVLHGAGWLASKIYRDRKSHGFLHRHWYARHDYQHEVQEAAPLAPDARQVAEKPGVDRSLGVAS